MQIQGALHPCGIVNTERWGQEIPIRHDRCSEDVQVDTVHVTIGSDSEVRVIRKVDPDVCNVATDVKP